MTYELAKKLRDAGFSVQHETEVFNHIDEEGNYCYFHMPTACRIPTLSELIDACGEHFEHLSKFMGEWYADESLHIESSRLLQGKGSTPEEAVANLWIALQTKRLLVTK